MNLKFFLKVFYITGLIFLYILVSFFVLVFSKTKNRKKNLCLNCSYFTKLGLKFFGIKVKLIKKYLPEKKPYLIVSNHLSYVDVLVISSFFPACFVSSVEISKDIFLGTLARLGGTLFVERRSKKRLLKDIDSISNALSNGMSVVLFPEGTSGNGETILPFKRTLFRSAIKSGTEVLPLCLRYVSIDGNPVNKENRDSVFWYGDMKFFPHFINLLKTKSIEVNLTVLKPVLTLSLKSDAVSKITYDSILQEYQNQQ